MKKKMSQSGMGLTEVLMAAGLVGGLSLVVMQLSTNSQKSVSGLESSSDILTVVQSIQGVLSNPKNCADTFRDRTAANHANVVTALKDNGSDSFKTMTADPNAVYGQRKVKIKSYSLSDATSDVEVSDHKTTHLVIDFDKGSGYNKNVSKRIPLKVELNADNTTIKGCVAFSHANDNLWSRDPDNSADIFYSGGNVGVGTAAPATKLDVAGGVKIANDTTACSAANEGTLRYNSTSKNMEFCNGTTWGAIGAGLQGKYLTTTCSGSCQQSFNACYQSDCQANPMQTSNTCSLTLGLNGTITTEATSSYTAQCGGTPMWPPCTISCTATNAKLF